jgi:hypothetical protein
MNKQNTKFGVLNTERNRMVTGHNGTGIFNTADGAKDLKSEMGGVYDSHLQVVKITEFNE